MYVVAVKLTTEKTMNNRNIPPPPPPPPVKIYY